jgi:hypothetical protein
VPKTLDLVVTVRVAPSNIPLPIWPGWAVRRRCPACPDRFRTGRAYRGHYALVHILGLR